MDHKPLRMSYEETVRGDFDAQMKGCRLSHEVRGCADWYKPYKNQGRFGNSGSARHPEGALAGV